jgi:hypothetical protein
LKEQSATLRLAAALVLALSNEPLADATICSVLDDAGADLDAEEEQRAIEWVTDRGLTGAMTGLRRRANSGWWAPSLSQWPSRAALASLGDQDAAQQILRGLQAWSWQTRTHAAIAAGRARLGAARDRLQALAAKPGAADPEAVQEALRAIEVGSM